MSLAGGAPRTQPCPTLRATPASSEILLSTAWGFAPLWVGVRGELRFDPLEFGPGRDAFSPSPLSARHSADAHVGMLTRSSTLLNRISATGIVARAKARNANELLRFGPMKAVVLHTSSTTLSVPKITAMLSIPGSHRTGAGDHRVVRPGIGPAAWQLVGKFDGTHSCVCAQYRQHRDEYRVAGACESQDSRCDAHRLRHACSLSSIVILASRRRHRPCSTRVLSSSSACRSTPSHRCG